MKGDVAAGPTKRSDFSAENTANRSSFLYKSHVRTIIEKDGLKMKETFEWSESSSENEDNTSDFIKIKSIQLAESADVDSVDGSYSIDIPLLDLPPIISGTNMLVKFGIEHSLAISDNDRARCFLLYGMDDQLSRIVICNERKKGMRLLTVLRILIYLVKAVFLNRRTAFLSFRMPFQNLMHLLMKVARLVDIQ